jgi:hypothetical protein
MSPFTAALGKSVGDGMEVDDILTLSGFCQVCQDLLLV